MHTMHHHHHHHHVQEGLGLIPVPCILKMKLVPPSLPRSSYVSSSSWPILWCLFATYTYYFSKVRNCNNNNSSTCSYHCYLLLLLFGSVPDWYQRSTRYKQPITFSPMIRRNWTYSEWNKLCEKVPEHLSCTVGYNTMETVCEGAAD